MILEMTLEAECVISRLHTLIYYLCVLFMCIIFVISKTALTRG